MNGGYEYEYDKGKEVEFLVRICVSVCASSGACQLRYPVRCVLRLGITKSQDAIVGPCIHAVTVALSVALLVSGFNFPYSN